MQPVDAPFLVLFGTITATAVALAIALSPRLSGSPPRLAARIGLHLLAHALVVLLVAALVNAQWSFFRTWSSLTAGSDAPGVASQVGAAPTAALQAAPTATTAGPSRPALPAVLPPLPTPGARLQQAKVTGAASGLTREVQVLLPQGYQHGDAATTYPVILALHGGYPADASHWTRHMQIDRKLDESVTGGIIAPSIVVMPTLNTAELGDAECVDGGGRNPAIETFIATDLVAWVRQHFRVAADRAAWNAFGYSTGGYCAAMIALHHPDTFATAVSFDGYLAPDFSGRYKPFGPGSAPWQRYDLVEFVRRAASPPPVALWLQRANLSAGADASGTSEADRLRAVTRAPMSLTLYDQPGVGHLTTVWRDEQPTAFGWLAATSPAFAPHAGGR